MTIPEKLLEIHKDLEWHCKCEYVDANGNIISGQPAKHLQNLRDKGYVFYSNETGNRYGKNMYCSNCGRSTMHTKLLSLEIDKSHVITRVNFTPAIRNRVLSLYGSRDTMTGGNTLLEIDHRVTPARVGGEKKLPKKVTDEELKKRYMPLTKINNNIKREACNKCISTDIRQPSLTGVNFFYQGSHKYEGSCHGCFWAYPEKWREELNKKLEGV